ncbi:MAG: hypothetical protein KatS3mg105_4700 [Gemmatales bacterium]|nr:MAG: hypothetical protein KatS3mg105_4700 [Gemmatales bacterium]
MFRIALPFPDSFLLLTLRWQELSMGGRIVSFLFCLFVPVLLVMLYRYEMKLVPRKTAAFLLSLRLGVVAILLFVIFLQPIIAHDVTETVASQVLVAVDRSESMKVVDPQRTNLEKLQLAKALRLFDGDNRLIDHWIESYRAKKPIEWVKKDESFESDAARANAEKARRHLHDALCRRIDELTRVGVVDRLFAKDGAGFLDAIADKHNIELLAFHRSAFELQREDLGEVLQPVSKNRKETNKKQTENKETSPTASRADTGTNLAAPLLYAQKQASVASGRKGKTIGVVLLTDGQHNVFEEGPPVAHALKMAEHQIPIYPVAIGAKSPPPDTSIVWVRTPSAVFKNVDVLVRVRVKISGLPDQDVTVELQPPGGKQPLKETIRHEGGTRFYDVPFDLRLAEVGTQTLRVSIKPVDGEIDTGNNERSAAINVADDKAKVLLVDGEARWEFHYLANALLRDQTMQVSQIVFNQPRLGRVPEEELQKIGYPRLHWPADPDALADYACIVLGDVSPAHLPLSQRLRLEKYVSETGGTLVIVAGKRHMPSAYVRQATNFVGGNGEADPIARMLPIESFQVVNPMQGFHVTLTQDGLISPFLRLEATEEESTTRWQKLPRHYWGIVGKVKPGAIPLAYLRDAANQVEAVKPGDVSDDPARRSGLIVRQNYGFGRVLFIGLDSTWRWRYKVGDRYHHRFWGQLIRWAASDKPLVAGNDFVRFGTPQPVYHQGDKIDVVVRLGENEKPLGTKSVAGARILLQEKPGKEVRAALVELKPRPAQPRVLAGEIAGLPAGNYAVELVIPEMAGKLTGTDEEGKPGPLRARFTVLPDENAEMIDLATNWDLLAELAAKSKGKVYTPETAADLIELLRQKTETRTRQVETRLWESWWALLLFLAFLSTEWLVRKLVGLP